MSSHKPTSSQNDSLKSELHYLCGQSLLNGGRYREAASEFNHVIAIQPKNEMVITLIATHTHI